MAWIVVTKFGVEWIFPFKPMRDYPCWSCTGFRGAFYGTVLRKGSIKKLIGRELTWMDNPVELK